MIGRWILAAYGWLADGEAFLACLDSQRGWVLSVNTVADEARNRAGNFRLCPPRCVVALAAGPMMWSQLPNKDGLEPNQQPTVQPERLPWYGAQR